MLLTIAERNQLITEVTAFLERRLSEYVTSEPPKPQQSTPQKVEMLTIKECTETVKGLTENTVRQLIAQQKIPSIRTGMGKRGKILVSKIALLSYFQGGV